MILRRHPRRQSIASPEAGHCLAPSLPKTPSNARLIVLGTALAAFAIVLFVPAVLGDGDTYWHIAAGRWMLDNQAVLRIDPFSYTFAGHPW